MREAQAGHWNVGVRRGGMLLFDTLMSVVFEGLHQALTSLREGLCLRWFPNCARAKRVGGTVVVLLTELPKIDVEGVFVYTSTFQNPLSLFVLAIRLRPKIWKRFL